MVLLIYLYLRLFLNLLYANFTKWSDTLKQLVGKLPTNCLSVFDDFVGLTVNPIQDGLFWDCSRMGATRRASLHKICHTYPTMIKLVTAIPYRKKIQKLYESHDRPLEFCWCQHFFTRNHQILLYQEIQIQIAFWYIISIYFNISWVFIDCYNKRD